jgi:hypothetical protein
MLFALGLLLLCAAVLYWWNLPTYPRVQSAESLRMIKLVYSACNMQDTQLLSRCEHELQQAHAAGQINDEEQSHFLQIIAQAKQGDWQTSAQAAMKFAQDQRK